MSVSVNPPAAFARIHGCTYPEKEEFLRLRLFALAALVLGLVPALALAGTTSTTKLAAKLAGKSEVPKGAPGGSGTATITITGSKVCWKFTFSGIGKPLAAHINKAPQGRAGPILVPLGGAFKTVGCTTSALANAIAAKPGAYYVNIHTAKFPAGAIRGQLAKASGGYGY